MSDHDHTDGDHANWRAHHQTNNTRYAHQWVLESDEYNGIAILELPWYSKWHKDNNPQWKEEWDRETKRVQNAAFLIQSAPFMLETLLEVASGDTSKVQEAIDRATGKLDWLGGPIEESNAQSLFKDRKEDQ